MSRRLCHHDCLAAHFCKPVRQTSEGCLWLQTQESKGRCPWSVALRLAHRRCSINAQCFSLSTYLPKGHLTQCSQQPQVEETPSGMLSHTARKGGSNLALQLQVQSSSLPGVGLDSHQGINTYSVGCGSCWGREDPPGQILPTFKKPSLLCKDDTLVLLVTHHC